MTPVDLIIHNVGQLVTCASGGKPKRGAEMLDLSIIENGAVAIANGTFAGIGTAEEILSSFEADETTDAEGRVVCPGFVDPHTHIVYAGDRLDEFELKIKGAEYLDILASGGGILSTVRATRDAQVEELVLEATARLDKMLGRGTTACEIKTGYGLDTDNELKMLAVIEQLDATHIVDVVPTLLAAHAVPPEFNGNSPGYVRLICDEILPRAREWYVTSRFAGRVPLFVDVFCERSAFTLDDSRTLLESAASMGFGIKAHVDQFTNLGGSRLAIGLGAASIDHLDAISDEEIDLLASSGTIGIVTPTVNFNHGSSRFADARRMIDTGCAIALSTDYNPGSAPCPSQPMAMAIACRYQKLLPAEAFNAATINAAFAAGIGNTHGSIEVGKRADVLILDAFDHREAIYEFDSSLINTVIANGSTVLW